ncbi:MAG: hypothetical protein WCY11_07865, partial [Novosphingobium sp.]
MRTHISSAPRRSERTALKRLVEDAEYRHYVLALVLLVAVFLMGGGSRDSIQSLIILRPLTAILFVSALGAAAAATWRQHRALTLLSLATLVLVILHLIPLPPSVWTALPGRSIMVEVYDAADIPLPWHALTLTPQRTWNALFAL